DGPARACGQSPPRLRGPVRAGGGHDAPRVAGGVLHREAGDADGRAAGRPDVGGDPSDDGAGGVNSQGDSLGRRSVLGTRVTLPSALSHPSMRPFIRITWDASCGSRCPADIVPGMLLTMNSVVPVESSRGRRRGNAGSITRVVRNTAYLVYE